MKKLACDRCSAKIGVVSGRIAYDVSRSAEFSRFGHKNEKYICEECLHKDPRYRKEVVNP